MATSARILLLFVLFVAGSSCDAQAPQIRITPNNDETLFETSGFIRNCIVDNVGDGVTVMLEWVRDGRVIDSGSGTQLLLHISQVEEVHEGEYSCRAILTPQSVSDPVTTVGPVSGGTLTVLSLDRIRAPAVQVLTAGSSGTLNCSYPGGEPTWRKEGTVVTGQFSSVSFADEGEYICDLYVIEHSASVLLTVMLYVVVPVEILDMSTPVHRNLTGNQPVTFAVEFRGRQSHDLSITWHHDGVALSGSDSRISNTFNSELARGRTVFGLPLARRADAGLYRVVIRSAVGMSEETVYQSQGEVTFQIDITVRPPPPANIVVDQISSRTAQVSWRLTNQTIDEGADYFIMRTTFANGSLADWRTIPGGLTSETLEDLIPANEYSVVLTAVNIDGQATTDPTVFRTLEGFPSISSLRIERLNATLFELSLSLAYTGGGAIAGMTVSYRPTADENREPTTLNDVSLVSVGQLGVRSELILTEQAQSTQVELEASMELEFEVVIRNEFNFESSVSFTVPAYSPPSVTTSTTSSEPPTSSGQTNLLPPWLIAVIASVVTILLMLVLVACIVGMCVRCHTSRSDKKASLNSVENGTSHTKSMDSIPATDPQRARSQSSSLPSGNYTPSLDENYVERKHKRELSECSSIGISKITITPSTTASNSPANFQKGNFNSQDKGLDCINELEGTHSDDSGTESERDRIKQQQMLSQQNRLNSQHVRGRADGSVCCSSHHSLVSSGSHSGQMMYSYLNYSDPKHLYTVTSPGRRHRAENTGMYSDCESVVSTDVSCSAISMPSSLALQHQQQSSLRSVQYRSPTPYNHAYGQPEESIV